MVDDIRTMVMNFNFHFMKIPSHFDEDFSPIGNAIANEYILSKPKGTRRGVIALTLVLLTCLPLVQVRALN